MLDKVAERPTSIQQADIDLGVRIRSLRKQNGLSQESLAAKVGISFQQIQKYEKGYNRVSFSRMVLISRGLGVCVSELIPAHYICKE